MDMNRTDTVTDRIRARSENREASVIATLDAAYDTALANRDFDEVERLGQIRLQDAMRQAS